MTSFRKISYTVVLSFKRRDRDLTDNLEAHNSKNVALEKLCVKYNKNQLGDSYWKTFEIWKTNKSDVSDDQICIVLCK